MSRRRRLDARVLPLDPVNVDGLAGTAYGVFCAASGLALVNAAIDVYQVWLAVLLLHCAVHGLVLVARYRAPATPSSTPPAAAAPSGVPLPATPAAGGAYPEPVWRCLEPLHRDSRPLRKQIAERIAQAIDAGRFPAGTTIPSQTVIAKHYGVSRTTAYDAVLDLVWSGRLQQRPEGGHAAGTPGSPATERTVQ